MAKKEYLFDVSTDKGIFWIRKNPKGSVEGVDVFPSSKKNVKGRVYAMTEGQKVKEIRIIF